MASHNVSDQDRKAHWIWLETQALREEHPKASDEEIANYLERRWADLPQAYKESIAPALFRLREAFQGIEEAKAIADNTRCLPLHAWERVPHDELFNLVDSFATADERLAALKSLLNARIALKAAIMEFLWARNSYLDQTWNGVETTKFLNGGLLTADEIIAEDEQGIRDLEAELPKRRRLEEEWRQSQREGGLPAGTGWVGSWYLGGGSYGKAFLWVRQDPQGRIIDRLVTKDARINDAMRDDPAAWVLHDGVYVPTEIRAPQMMAGKPGSESILCPRGWRQFQDRAMFRVLMEFCPYGDLWVIRYGMYDPGSAAAVRAFQPKMPQAFLWYVFENLATAGVLMEKGEIKPEAMRGWHQIFHSDIKLPNILLGSPDPNKYCNYPRPILADFGFAQFCPPGQQCIARGGTPTSECPESTGLYFDKVGRPVHRACLNRRSDVWCVGYIIYDLMSLDEGNAKFNFREDPTPREPPMHVLQGHYPDAMLELVRCCMRYHPEDRIGFQELLNRIRRCTGEHHDPSRNHVRGLRGAAAHSRLWQDRNVMLTTPVDKWPLYTHLAHAPDGKTGVPRPPHKTRKFSKQMEYKGPVSADTRSLRRAGSVRKHAATHTQQSHERFLNRRKKMEAKKRTKSGFHVPDSSDDDADDEDVGIERLAQDEREQWQSVSRTADAPQQAAEEMDVEAPNTPPHHSRARASQSRSAAAGAGPDERRVLRVVNGMDAESSSPPAQPARSPTRQSRSAGAGAPLVRPPSFDPDPSGTPPRRRPSVRRKPLFVHKVGQRQTARWALRESASPGDPTKSDVVRASCRV